MEKIKMSEGKSLLWGRGYVSLEKVYSEDGEIILNTDKLNEDFCPVRIKNIGLSIIKDFMDRDSDPEELFDSIIKDNEDIEVDVDKLAEFLFEKDFSIDVKDIKSVSLYPYVEQPYSDVSFGTLEGYDYSMTFEYDMENAITKYNEWAERTKDEQDIER